LLELVGDQEGNDGGAAPGASRARGDEQPRSCARRAWLTSWRRVLGAVLEQPTRRTGCVLGAVRTALARRAAEAQRLVGIVAGHSRETDRGILRDVEPGRVEQGRCAAQRIAAHRGPRAVDLHAEQVTLEPSRK